VGVTIILGSTSLAISSVCGFIYAFVFLEEIDFKAI
jgi:hypothetical protein